MPNPFQKSYKISQFVKEQRVDGSWFIKQQWINLRCTLMGGESCYQINIPSKQIIIPTRDFWYWFQKNMSRLT